MEWELWEESKAETSVLLELGAGDRVAVEAEDVEFRETLEIEDLLHLFDLVVAQRQALQVRHLLQARYRLDFVVVEREVGQTLELVQALDFPDAVEGQVCSGTAGRKRKTGGKRGK